MAEIVCVRYGLDEPGRFNGKSIGYSVDGEHAVGLIPDSEDLTRFMPFDILHGAPLGGFVEFGEAVTIAEQHIGIEPQNL